MSAFWGLPRMAGTTKKRRTVGFKTLTSPCKRQLTSRHASIKHTQAKLTHPPCPLSLIPSPHTPNYRQGPQRRALKGGGRSGKPRVLPNWTTHRDEPP